MTARILVVDDINANLRLLDAKLRSEYYEVATAASGEEALRQVAAWSPDVVLLDVMMPGMDGYEVCRRLKSDPASQHIPVVMVTALVDQSERVKGLEAGADDFLSKPVNDAMLFARLRALLRVKQVLDAWQLRADTARDLGFEPPDSPSLDIRGARALLVGETEPEREAIRAGLADDGVVVVAAAGEAEAWPVLLDPAQDLVLLNLGLPGGDALRLASRLRATVATRDLPVILIAAADQHAQVLRGFDIGANDHLLRPVDPNELRARARNQIRRKRYQERLRADLDRSLELAVTDPLTGLRNRRYVRRHLDAATRAGGAAVLLIDIDRFKPINDLHGHAAGDAALREVADRLRRHVRAADVVARYGGEEFLVVMAGALVEEAEGVAERLRLAIAEEPVDIGSARLRVTISIGIAVARPGEGTDSVVTAADSALYRAKRGGRDRVEIAVQA